VAITLTTTTTMTITIAMKATVNEDFAVGPSRPTP
jgi:hypothetical protein